MTDTTVEPHRLRAPAHRRGDTFVPQSILLYGLLGESTARTDIPKSHVYSSYLRGNVFYSSEDLDTTVLVLDEGTEGSIETPVSLDEESLRKLAKSKPRELIRLLEHGGLEPPDLTFAAEAAGAITDSAIAVSALLKLVQSDSPLVREGAVYGLAKHVPTSAEAMAELIRLAAEDPSSGVRLASQEELDDL